jgi:hypothetical protein
VSSGILSGAWGGLLLSSAPTGLPVHDWLVGRASRSGQVKDYRLVVWLIKFWITFSCILTAE